MKRRADPDGKLDAVTTGTAARSLKILGLTVKAGVRAAGHSVTSLFVDKKAARARRDRLFLEQFDEIALELGKLKGSLMKAGQLISMYGDYFFPPKFNKILKHLQADSTPLAWDALERQLKAELGDATTRLTIDTTPFAAASLGQVHKAKVNADGRDVCVKIQYPGIDRAIDSDLKALRPLLRLFGKGGHGERFDDLMAEFKDVLHRELDYTQERAALDTFRAALKGDARYALPDSFAAFSTGRVLTTAFMPGVPPDDASVLSLPQSRRSALGAAMMDLYFFEIFTMRLVQTDPHFGNFKVQVGAGVGDDRLVLLDFGSMRPVSEDFATHYAQYVAGAFLRDEKRVVDAALAMGLLLPSDAPDVRRELFELTEVLMEPLKIAERARADLSDLKERERELEDIPDLIAAKTRRFIDKIGMRPPPRELLLLDRKLLGVFVFLATLKAVVPGRAIIGKYVPL